VARNLVPLVARALGSKVVLDADLNEHVGGFRGNVAQLESVIVNLAVNARDAMEGGGRVVLFVGDRELDSDEAQRRGLGDGGSFVALEVTDTGSGIAPETIGRVFEPFFSTKGDRGSGLGLAMVKRYAEQCGGSAYIQSSVGRGTTVSVVFPRCDETLDETNAKTMPLSMLPSGKESVLIVVTEESMRSTISQILSVLGYSVRTATNAREAAVCLRESMSDLLILDSADPGGLVSALTTAAEAAEQTACRVVELQSAGDRDASPRMAGARVLFKPFSLADLASVVREALDGAPLPARFG
jgi:CheY-like chemotaxis protein